MPLRILHVLGPTVLILQFPPGLRRQWRQAAWLPVILLAGWQGWQSSKSLGEVENRLEQGEGQLVLVKTIERQADDLRQQLADHPGTGPVLQIVQNSQGYEWVLGHYALIGRQQGGPVEDLPLKPKWNWSADIPDQVIVKQWLSARALWPIHLDARTRGLLGALVADPACRARPEDYFLVPNAGANGFDCLRRRD